MCVCVCVWYKTNLLLIRQNPSNQTYTYSERSHSK